MIVSYIVFNFLAVYVKRINFNSVTLLGPGKMRLNVLKFILLELKHSFTITFLVINELQTSTNKMTNFGLVV
jgi:hypothetical protein